MASERGDGAGGQRTDARRRQAEDLTDVLIVQVALIAEEQDLPLTLRKHLGDRVDPQPELADAERIVVGPEIRAGLRSRRRIPDARTAPSATS